MATIREQTRRHPLRAIASSDPLEGEISGGKLSNEVSEVAREDHPDKSGKCTVMLSMDHRLGEE
jgi:hypothetical protein